MPDEFEEWTGSGTDFLLGKQLGEVTYKVHPRKRCEGRNCVIHNPSDHTMREWPLNYRFDKNMMERICVHGVGHPDPDDLAYHEIQGQGWVGVHGCDGCCHE